MGMNAGATFLPGRGTVFLGEPGTTPPNYKTVDPLDPTTYTGWECLGHTSRENTVALSKDGGEAEQKGSWWDAAIKEKREPSAWTWTVNALQVDKPTLETAFPGGVVEDGAFWVPGADATIDKAAFILMVDNSGRMAVYMPNTPMALGDAPELDIENFFEIQLSGSILSDPETGRRMGFFHPSFDATAPAG